MISRIFTKKGFSLLESIIVISIIGILAAVVAASLLSARNKNALTDGQTLIVRTLEDARGRALSGVGTDNYCVRIDTFTVALYGVACTGTPIINTTLPAVITTATNPINPDFVFNRITGGSNRSSTIVVTLTNANNGAFVKVDVTPSGQVFPH